MPTKILNSALSASTRKRAAGAAAAAAGSGTRLTAVSERRLGGVMSRAYSAASASVAAGVRGGGTGTTTGRPWPDLDASKLQVTRTQRPQTPLPASELVFGRNFTDHMVTAEWSAEDGWLAPRIGPYANFAMDPATCVLHYAFTAFEGSKAYRSRRDGSVRLFRPDRNWARLNRSVTRIALPGFDADEMTKIISRFIALDQHFVPDVRGCSLYLRPTVIGTQATLGVGPPGRAMFFCIASPVGPYYASGFRAVNLEATTDMVRAWPGGAGDAKLGANYAPCVVPQVQAASRGYNQNLWVFGPEEKVTEVGTMNLFVVMKKNDGSGRTEIITAPLDGMILAGITRESVLDLARERLADKGFDVSERYTTMPELVRAADEGRLLEVFGTGTAAVVSPVRRIKYRDGEIDCGLAADAEAGEIAAQMKDWIEEIQYGDYDHPWSVKVC